MSDCVGTPVRTSGKCHALHAIGSLVGRQRVCKKKREEPRTNFKRPAGLRDLNSKGQTIAKLNYASFRLPHTSRLDS